MYPLKKIITVFVVSGASLATIQADEVNPGSITTFEAGTPAVADEMNANFAALISAINDNAQRMAALETQLAILDPFTSPPIGNSSYTLVSFEAQILASNCNWEQVNIGTEENEVIVDGPNYCSQQSVHSITLSSNMATLNFNSDGSGSGSEIYDEDMLRSPSYNGVLNHAIEIEDEAFASNFTFTWTQDANVVTVQDDAPDEPPFELTLSYDGAVAVVRWVGRGDTEGGDAPVDDDGAGDKASQYAQVLGVAVRN